MRMNREREFSEFAGARNKLARRRRHLGPPRSLTNTYGKSGYKTRSFRSAQLHATDRVGRGPAILQSVDMVGFH
jgi:hypothetical protein